jgi:GAF domain-containing protein
VRIPPRRRIYITTGLSVVAVGLVALSGAEAGDAGSLRPWWIVLSVGMSVVGAAVPGYEQIRKERQRRRAAVQMRVTMNDALDPIVRHLGRLARASNKRRESLIEATIPMILYSAVHLIGVERVRACWFRLVEDSPRRLVPDKDAGRADQPERVFEEGTPEGDPVFDMIRNNEHVVCADVDAEPPPGWHASKPHGYRSFVAVPVVAGQTAYGMLTVDAVDVGGVTEDDVQLVRLLAGLLATALAGGAPEERSRWLGRARSRVDARPDGADTGT